MYCLWNYLLTCLTFRAFKLWCAPRQFCNLIKQQVPTYSLRYRAAFLLLQCTHNYWQNKIPYILCYIAFQKNDTMLHTVTSTHITDFGNFARDVAERVTIKWWFAIPPLLTNVSALPRKTWTWTWTSKIVFFCHAVYCVTKTKLLRLAIFDTHQPILIIFCRQLGRIIKHCV